MSQREEERFAAVHVTKESTKLCYRVSMRCDASGRFQDRVLVDITTSVR